MNKLRLSFASQINAQCHNVAPYSVYVLKEEVDIAVLTAAVNRAMQFHPTFRTKVVKEGGLYYLVENDRPAIVLESDWETPRTYGTDEFNEHTWLIAAGGKKIMMTNPHFLSDGMGALAFMKTVLRFYFEAQGVAISSDVGLVAVQDIPRTFEDSYALADTADAKPEKLLPGGLTGRLPKELFETDDNKTTKYRFVFDRQVIRNLSHRSNSSSFAVLCSVLCKAFARLAGEEKGEIKITLPIDMRAYYGSITDLMFVHAAELCYDVQENVNASMDLAAGELRRQFDRITEKSNLDFEMKRYQRLLKMSERLPAVLNVGERFFGELFYAPRKALIYTHLTHLGLPEEIEQRLDDFYMTFDRSAWPMFVALCSNFRNEVSVVLAQSTKNDAYVAEVEKVLQEENIPYRKEKLEQMPSFRFEYYNM